MNYPAEFLEQDKFVFESYEEWRENRTGTNSKSRSTYEEVKELIEADWEHERIERYKEWLQQKRLFKIEQGVDFISDLIHRVYDLHYNQEMMKYEMEELKKKVK